MSQVRMCDRCGAIFSVRDGRWTTLSMTDGGQGPFARTEELDLCNECAPESARVPGKIRPQLPGKTI